ncbi:uncharacterized protein METZ01_LOCUS60107, partial [marine metagenome]
MPLYFSRVYISFEIVSVRHFSVISIWLKQNIWYP